MDERRLVHPDLIPARHRAGSLRFERTRKFPGQVRFGKPRRAGAALPGRRCIAKTGRADINPVQAAYCGAFASAEQQEQQAALLSGKTGIEVSSSSFPSRSSVTVSKNLRSMARSLRLRPRNLSKIRIPALRHWRNRQCRPQTARSLSGIKQWSERCRNLCSDKESRSERLMITTNKRGSPWRRCKN
jgi:hypothetical protein